MGMCVEIIDIALTLKVMRYNLLLEMQDRAKMSEDEKVTKKV